MTYKDKIKRCWFLFVSDYTVLSPCLQAWKQTVNIKACKLKNSFTTLCFHSPLLLTFLIKNEINIFFSLKEKGHDVCNFLSNNSANNSNSYIHNTRQIKQNVDNEWRIYVGTLYYYFNASCWFEYFQGNVGTLAVSYKVKRLHHT